MRKFLIFSGVLVLLLVLAVGVVLFSPPIHKAVFLWAVDGQVDAVSVEKVRFTGSSFEVEQFNLAHQGMHFATDRVEVKASWIDIARTKELHIDEVNVRGLKADLATMATASGGGLGAWLDLLGGEKTASNEAWEGILAKMKPSSEVSIGRVRLDGQVILPDEKTVDLNVTLDDLAVGEKAKIRLQGAFIDEGGTSLVDRASYDLSLELDQTSAAEMNGISGSLALVMMGDQLNPAGQLDLNGNWSLTKTPNGESLTVYLAEAGNPRPLIDTELEMNVSSGDLDGRLAASLKGSLVPVSLLGLPSIISSASISTDGQVGWNYKTGVGRFDLRGGGVLEERPLQYQLSGKGTADSLPAMTGFIKTGFADEAGAGNLTVSLDVNSKGEGEVIVPVVVQRGDNVSKLTLSTDVASRNMDPFQLAVKGESVYLADLQSVGKALAAWGYSMQQLDTVSEVKSEGTVTAGSGVPWEGVSGNATVAIQRLVLPQGYTLLGMNAAASISPESISLSSFSTRIEQGSIVAKGDLIHAANSPTPFQLKVEGAVRNIPSDLVDLGSGSPITGTWNGNLAVQGQAREIQELAESVQISLEVEGSAGLLQFSKINENAGKASQVIQLGSLLSQFIKDDRLTAITQMTDYLQRVPYDSIRFKVDRFANGQVAIHEFTIEGPELFLSGNGSIDAQSWASLAEGALDMSLAMGSKGSFGESAAVLGLTGEQLSGEYQLWRQPVNISGTLSNPNYSGLKDMIFRSFR
jgi:hypothetical protein